MPARQSKAVRRHGRLENARICMVVHQYLYRDSRVQRYAKALAGEGVQVDVLALRDPQRSAMEHYPGVGLYTIPLSRGYSGVGSYLLEYLAGVLLFGAYLLRLHLRKQYQVIHVHNMPDCLVFAGLIPKFLGARLILDVHDPMPEVFMDKFGVSADSIPVRLVMLQERASAYLANEVLAANRFFKTSLVKRGVPPDRVTIVHNAPDPDLFRADSQVVRAHDREDGFCMIYPGTIAPRYGLDVAIRALPTLRRKIPGLRLRIVGPNTSHCDELSHLTDRLGVSSIVEFAPAIPVQEVPGEIRNADIGIYPALPSAHMSIALPTKVLEFAAMGKPIVASRLEVLTGMFPESAVAYFEPGDVDGFCACVLQIHASSARRVELTSNAMRICSGVASWERERDTYFAVLDRLLATGNNLHQA